MCHGMLPSMTSARLSFEAEPSRYRHWKLEVDPPIATLSMAVDPSGGLRDDYELKLNSYDLAVDIELHDALQRLRFEHPDRQGDSHHRSARQAVLRGGQHPDARDRHPCPQGRLLQVHQRDPQRHGGDVGRRRTGRHRRGERNGRGRRLRTRPCMRRDPPRRRSVLRGLAPRGAAARGAPRNWRAHSNRRQAARATRPRGRVLDEGRRHQRQAGGRVGTRRRDRAAHGVRRARAHQSPRGPANQIDPTRPRESSCVRSSIGSSPSSAATTWPRSRSGRSARSRSRSRRAASSTTPFSTFDSTTPTSARGCCGPKAPHPTCSRPTGTSKETRLARRAKCACSGNGR